MGRDSKLKPFKEDSSDINHFIITVVKREINARNEMKVTSKECEWGVQKFGNINSPIHKT